MRVKICGITSPQDAMLAAESGADAVGLNFVGGPRQLDPDRATAILETLPPLVAPVALVRLEHGRISDDLIELLGGFWVSHLQLYGEISPGSLASLASEGFRAIPVVPVRNEGFANTVNEWLSRMGGRKPAAVVLDAYDAERLGGTGKAFRWDWVTRAAGAGQMAGWPPVILAGGLTPANVAEAIAAMRPYGVDVSSGVEAEGKPGIKDAWKMCMFVQNARGAVVP